MRGRTWAREQPTTRALSPWRDDPEIGMDLPGICAMSAPSSRPRSQQDRLFRVQGSRKVSNGPRTPRNWPLTGSLGHLRAVLTACIFMPEAPASGFPEGHRTADAASGGHQGSSREGGDPRPESTDTGSPGPFDRYRFGPRGGRA